MRLAEFWERMRTLLGSAHAESYAGYQVLSELGGRTVEEALAAGEPAKDVWRAVCEATDAPPRMR